MSDLLRKITRLWVRLRYGPRKIIVVHDSEHGIHRVFASVPGYVKSITLCGDTLETDPSLDREDTITVWCEPKWGQSQSDVTFQMIGRSDE